MPRRSSGRARQPSGSALEELAAHDRDLLQELLERFGVEYAAAKRRESVVDFEDLQLAARDLLRDDEDVREATRLRFRMVMVDEFQDTNRLQCELIDLVAHPDLTEVFTVGDEFQSIYGFRHADLEVFRERRAEAPSLLALTQNYRSRPQVLAAVNHLFGDAFGDDYQPLVVVGGVRRSGVRPSRRAARHRQDELRRTPVSTGARERRGESRVAFASSSTRARPIPGEIVVLFAAGHRRRALRGGASARGSPDVSRDRARLLRPAAGRRPSRLPAAAPQPLRRRGARDRARLALRRRVQRRARAHPAKRDAPTALHGARAGTSRAARPERRAAASRLPPAVRATRARVCPHRARGALRAHRQRARLRPGRSRPLGRRPALREPAQARAPRAGLRVDPRCRHRRLRPLRARAGRARREESSRPSPRRKAEARFGC